MPVPLSAAICESALRLYSHVAPTERGGYRLARFARALRPRGSWASTFRTPDGLVFDLDLATYPDCCMAYGLYELDTARLIKKLLRPGDHFVDGGANIGYFTLLAARCVGPTGRVDAFEPEPHNRARLEKNIERNGLIGRVTVHSVALSDQAGETTIYLPAGGEANHGCASMYHRDAPVAGQTAVPAARMDRVLAGASPTLIKLDVEGAEPLAVSGMTGLLQGPNPPRVIAEYNPIQSTVAGFAAWEFVERLLAAQPRYRVYQIAWRLRRLEPIPQALTRLRQCNLLFEVA